MSIKGLEKLDERSTIWQVIHELQKHFPPEKLASLSMVYRSFNMTHSFLPEIWDRILEDAQLDNQYWSIYAKLYDPNLEEEGTPTPEEAEILKRYKRHQNRLNLDMEDWFLHAHILMEKFARLAKELMLLTSANAEDTKQLRELPTKSFHEHINFVLKTDNQKKLDVEYVQIVREMAAWYSHDLKNVRDDLIQHETVARFWGHFISQYELRVSRFRHSKKLVQELYRLRDKYAETHAIVRGKQNFFNLLSFFETYIDRLEKSDSDRVRQIRKTYGRDFPHIPTLYRRINDFFSLVNNHFMSKIRSNFPA